LKSNSNKQKNSGINLGGRPRKFKQASRPVTVTLPDDTLKLLDIINPDRAMAIDTVVKKITGIETKSGRKINSLVEIIKVDNDKGLILISPSKALRKIPFLRMVEITTGKFLLLTPSGMSSSNLEVAIQDLINEIPSSNKYELSLLRELHNTLATHRRSSSLSKEEVLLVSL
jgi:hypothetical protein